MNGRVMNILKEYSEHMGADLAKLKRRFKNTPKKQRSRILENMKAHVRMAQIRAGHR